MLEVGSGGGFLRELFPPLLSSEIVAWQGVSLVADAHALPFPAGGLRAIVMTNVFHHLPNASGPSSARPRAPCAAPERS